MSIQNDIENIMDLFNRGKISLDEANVQIVLCERVKVVKNQIPSSVRKALNNAVKQGKLCHMKKDGHLPEVYFRPQNRDIAIKEREDYARKILLALRSCLDVNSRTLQD